MLKLLKSVGTTRVMGLVTEPIWGRTCSLGIMAPNTYKKRYSQQAQQTTSLPRLPVPPLQQTMQRYLRSVKPLVSPEEFRITENLAKEFASSGGIGEKLQKLLEERAANTENWLAEWWLNSAYLDFRWPVVVYSNPGLVFPIRQFKSKSEQLEHAAKLLAAALDFNIKLNEHKLPQERMGPHELDMSQYYKVLGTCRVPGITRDELRLPDYSNPSNHIVVAHNNHFFAVPVYGDKKEPLNMSQILAQLQDVVSKSSSPANFPVGILTSENRNTWGKVHKLLKKDKQNCDSLDMIERSLFLVCLDGPPSAAEVAAPNRMTAAALKMVHGGSSKSNSANRWFDKTIQFVIGPDGEVGLTYEHSPAEGQPIAVLMDHIEAYCSKSRTGDSSLPATSFAQPTHLPFNISSEVEKTINEAKTNFDSLIDDLEMHCFTFSAYGKEFIKSQKLSPDSYIQMAIQYAFYRVHNEPGAHYESASTRRFIHGRTETIRSCSLESVHFARTMLNKTASTSEKAASLRAAIQSHKEYATFALGGEGVDRHLLGLKLLAVENKLEIPKLFLDTGYTKSGHMRLSTSQVAGRCHSFMCYGPLVPDGYGCCYNPRSDEIVFGTSAFKSNPQTSALKFCKSLEDSLNDMQSVLTNAPQAKL